MAAIVSVFMSYARLDDKATHGRISQFRTDIEYSYEALTGNAVEVFQDVDSVGLGEQWKDRIRAGLSSSSVLLAFVSPAFLRSAWCREELRDFLGFLAGRSTQGLLIPLIFGDVNKIEDAFRDDELWQEVRRRQWLEVPDLRIADRGTERWQRSVERVAARIADVLGSAASGQPAPSQNSTGEGGRLAEDQQRTQLALTEWSKRAPGIMAALTEYNRLQSQLNAVLQASGPPLQNAQTFAQKMTAAKQLAGALPPLADESPAIASRLRAEVLANDEGVRRIFRFIRRGSIDVPSTSIEEFKADVRRVARFGADSLLSAGETADAVSKVQGYTQQVDTLLAPVTNAFLIFTELRGAFRGWLEELEILDDL